MHFVSYHLVMPVCVVSNIYIKPMGYEVLQAVKIEFYNQIYGK